MGKGSDFSGTRLFKDLFKIIKTVLMIHFVGGYVSRYHFYKRKRGNRRPHFNGCIIDSVFPLVRIYRTDKSWRN